MKELSLEKNEKVTRMKYVLKERDELEDPAKDVIKYIRMENIAIRMTNSKLQKEMFVYFNNFVFFYLLELCFD